MYGHYPYRVICVVREHQHNRENGDKETTPVVIHLIGFGFAGGENVFETTNSKASFPQNPGPVFQLLVHHKTW